VFVTLPLAFADMPLGTLAAIAFFLLLFVAALASSISLLELGVAMLVRRRGWRRGTASLVAATTCFVVGIASVLSFNLWSAWYPLTWLPGFGHATVFDLLDYLTSNVLLPLTGLLLALLAGWALPEGLFTEELRLGPRGGRLLRALLRYIVPPAIAAIALAALLG
jgi:NSS family neurotransmitter:Na+ symporter